MFLYVCSIFDDLVNLFIGKHGGSASPCNSRTLWSIIYKDFGDCGFPKLILRHEALNWYLSKAIELAYRFFMFGKELFTWLVVKFKWWGPWRHFEAIQKKQGVQLAKNTDFRAGARKCDQLHRRTTTYT